jgi:hypothetical protein
MPPSEIISQFNIFAQNQGNQSIIKKALTSATGSGEALIPQELEKTITDTVVRMSPELALVESKQSASKWHEFNRLTSRPSRGGAMGESAVTPTTQSTSERTFVTSKIVRRKGVVTNFIQDTSRKYIDTAAWEMENHLQSHALDLIYYILYGNADIRSNYNSTFGQRPANESYEFDGLDKFIASNRVNESLGGTVPASLKVLDDMIDASNRRGGSRHRRVFEMSPEMLSKFSQLLTNVRLNQGLTGAGITQVDIGGGWRLNAYRDIPIIESTSTAPTENMNATLTLAAEDTGVGGLSDDTYYVRIAPMTVEGEQGPDTEQSIVLSGGTATQRIRLSLNRHHQDADGKNSVFAYKIYVGTVSGALTLNCIISAFQYDSAGTPTDDMLVGTNYGYITSLTPGTDVPTHMQSDVPLQKTGDVYPELIFLWDLDPIQGLGKFPYTNTAGDKFNGLVTTKQLAEIDDYIQFLVKSYPALCDSFEATSYLHRGLRVE